MRTTIDIDDSLLARLRNLAHREGVPFRSLLHRVIQRGLDSAFITPEPVYRVPAVTLGQVREGVDLVKSLRLADTLEDNEILRKISERR